MPLIFFYSEYQLGQEDGKSVMMLVHHTRNTSAKQWNETRVIALEGVLRIFKTFIASLARDLNDITSHWKKLMGYITLYWDSDNIEIALAAVKVQFFLHGSHLSTIWHRPEFSADLEFFFCQGRVLMVVYLGS